MVRKQHGGGFEKVGVGSVMPRSVPASFAVKPDRKITFLAAGA